MRSAFRATVVRGFWVFCNDRLGGERDAGGKIKSPPMCFSKTKKNLNFNVTGNMGLKRDLFSLVKKHLDYNTTQMSHLLKIALLQYN